jgi:hypothetical protein
MLGATAAGWSPAHAQLLRVEVRDSASAEPVVRALVSVTDEAGTAVADGLTGEQGMLTLRLPRAGTWSVSVRRIGIAPRRLAGVRVDSGATVALPIRVANVRMLLPRVSVRANVSSCGRAPTGDDRAGTLWEQITLALRSSVLARAEAASAVSLRFTQRHRILSTNLEELSVEMLTQGIGMGRPYAAADPDTLARYGYVREMDDRGREYFAPDEVVLLSRAFVQTHCFDAPKRDADATLAELRFRPVRGRRVPDVEGTAYVDTLSGELRRIDFRYAGAAHLVPYSARHAGGSVALQRLPNGRWIVSNWFIRMPVFLETGSTDDRVVVNAYREVGGTVEPLDAPGPPRDPPAARPPAPR